MRRISSLFLALVWVGSLTFGVERISYPSPPSSKAGISSKNWMSNPEIKRIRRQSEQIDNSIKRGQMKKVRYRTSEKQSAGPMVEATLFKNRSGTVQKYQLSGGSDDSSADASYYYDRNGKLRFSFQSLRAVNGTEEEIRTYFGKNGAVLYQNKRLLKGPGYPGGFPDAIKDPRKDFKSQRK